MDTEQAKLAGALFHTLRGAQRSASRDTSGSRKIYDALVKRGRYEEAERRFYEKLARWDWERSVEG